MPETTGGSDSRDDRPGGGGSGTTEEDLPPDLPPDTEAAVMAAIQLKTGIKGAFTDLSEHCRKIPNGQRLAAGTLVAARKVRGLADVVAAGILANNVKSDNRPITGTWGIDDQAILMRVVEILDLAGLGQDETV